MSADPAVILSAYTGFLLVKSFASVQEYAEEILARPVFTHEFASESLQEELRQAITARGDFAKATARAVAADSLLEAAQILTAESNCGDPGCMCCPSRVVMAKARAAIKKAERA